MFASNVSANHKYVQILTHIMVTLHVYELAFISGVLGDGGVQDCVPTFVSVMPVDWRIMDKEDTWSQNKIFIYPSLSVFLCQIPAGPLHCLDLVLHQVLYLSVFLITPYM